MELKTLELGGIWGGIDSGSDPIPKSSLLANSCQFLVVWQELARISSILGLTLVARQGLLQSIHNPQLNKEIAVAIVAGNHFQQLNPVKLPPGHFSLWQTNVGFSSFFF